MSSTRILAITSSLRRASVNTGLIRAAQEVPGFKVELFTPKIPLFNQDEEGETVISPEVVKFRSLVKNADAILFSTCEHNYSISAALKNAIDWASRGPLGNCFDGKPCAVIGAAAASGSLRSQLHLREILVGLNMYVLNKPAVLVNVYSQPGPIDLVTGDVVDPVVKSNVKSVLVSLVEWSERLKLGKTV